MSSFIKKLQKNSIRSALPLGSVVLLSAALLTGCAGNPPTAQMAVTQSAVNEAVSGGGNQYAPLETKSAQDKWTQAQTALNAEDYEQAKQLAEQAEWDARLATRKTQAAKADAALQDAQKSIQQIREEGMINSELQQKRLPHRY
ncbi:MULTISPECIES: DUF4398 domain-containing protein [Pseudomonas]|uniref:Putative lipoprotein n=1 Tax=Pseudomonas luteola TaxID=47886 RepID=A0A2X2BWQ6_PSELU|nr:MULTISPECIES: DUF4398 domain-containing protein [Pseudomonas]MCG7373981.1 DUF4398 domain-containing protein [Pseudomonas luteola]RRW40690.1 DUF4398 domain-containing protein [Pseudomonas luteola]SHJ43550.1 protein of unknown function [Pseudomonas zeshuii]SPZ00157.1 putative lipoprotein [Pseudomonas luteola]